MKASSPLRITFHTGPTTTRDSSTVGASLTTGSGEGSGFSGSGAGSSFAAARAAPASTAGGGWATGVGGATAWGGSLSTKRAPPAAAMTARRTPTSIGARLLGTASAASGSYEAAAAGPEGARARGAGAAAGSGEGATIDIARCAGVMNWPDTVAGLGTCDGLRKVPSSSGSRGTISGASAPRLRITDSFDWSWRSAANSSGHIART